MCYLAFVLNRLGDFSSRLSIPKLLVYTLKKKLGVLPDFEAELEATANTALAYHAGGTKHD